MLKERRLSRQKQLTDETCETLPRFLPKKVQQETIKHNYQQLIAIPTLPFVQNIKHLYLSHNKIANLKGIQAFVILENLNVSYNNLERVQQLKRISNHLLLKHLKLRMNPLPFGYQDYAVGLFQNLKTFENINFKQQSKQRLRALRNYVSRNILQFFKRITKLGEALQYNENKQNIDFVNRKQKKQIKKSSLLDLNNNFINKLKSFYTFPNELNLRNSSVGGLLNKIFQIIQISCQSIVHVGQNNKQNFVIQTRNAFQQIKDMVLLKYSARHDKNLINYLEIIRSQQNIKNYDQAFSRLGFFQEECHISQIKMEGGGIKSSSIYERSAKYIRKVDPRTLIQHPMNRLANWQQPKNIKTLIPIQETKWYNFYNEAQQTHQEDYLFQQVPIFIYCKEYLEVIAEIIFSKVSQILNKQREIIRFRQFEVNINKQHIIIRSPQQELEFSLTKSDVLSFGNQQNQTLKFDKTQIIFEEKMEKTKSQFIQTKQKSYQKQAFKENSKIDFSQNQFFYNPQKYSLHQINLAYKVFRSLKKKIVSKKQKKTILH